MRDAKTVRSYLFVPADRPERFAKAFASGADAVIIDLEDAVAPENKDAARAALGEWLHGLDPAMALPAELVVRVNDADSQWFDADRTLVVRSPRIDEVLLPKANAGSPVDVFDKQVLALIETAAGIDALRSITYSPHVSRLVFGSIDFQLDLGITGEGEELLFFRSQLVLASRLARLPAPVDGVSTALDDPAALAADITRARRLGFGAKLCIHPAQVAAVTAGFRPSDEELDWARRVLAAAEAAGGAAIAVDGKMVDRPVLERARAMLSAAGEGS